MITDFEKTLDDVISRWNNVVGYYTWDSMFKDEFGTEDKLQILNRLHSDKLLDSGGGGHFLNAKGFDIKRNIGTKGYLAQKRKEEEKDKRELELYDISKSNLLWTKRAAWIFFATLIVAILSAIITYFKY